MQQYSTYKPSNVEWLGDVPSHWKVERIKDVVQLRTEKTSEKSEQKDYLELEDIEQNTGNIIGFRNTSEVSSDVTLFKEGDVLFGKLRPYLAKYWLATIDGKCTGEIIALNCLKVKNTFFKYFVGSQLFIEQCTTVSYGAKMPRVDWTRQIAYFYIAIPNKTEQTAIAAYLDQATANIDKVIGTKQKQLEKLEQYKQSKIHECVTKGLNPDVTLKPSGIDWIGDVPQHWKVERLKYVVSKIGSGVTPKGGAAVYLTNGIPLIRSQNVHFDGLDFSDIACITEEIHDDMSGSKVKRGDVLLNITGASIGRCYYYDLDDEANVNQHVCILRPNELMTTNFLYYLMMSEVGQSQIFSGFKGSGREGLGNEAIKVFKIPLPKTKEQRKISDYLDFFCDNIKKEKSIIEQQIEKLKQYRKCLIHECVTGKRRVINEYK